MSKDHPFSRRGFVLGSGAAALVGCQKRPDAQVVDRPGRSNRPLVGCIGAGSRWSSEIAGQVMKYADVAAICDVDGSHRRMARANVLNHQAKRARNIEVTSHEDYRAVLDRKDIDVVVICTPEHWHTKILIDAMRAGKDVFCEKPLTLTIDEGKQIIKVLDQTQRIVQVGTQQRSSSMTFLTAIAMIRAGRLGQITNVEITIGEAPTCPPLSVRRIPFGLNWEKWLGQAPEADYVSGPSTDATRGFVNSRCHQNFRWWYEYSGGKMTDWGAHHVDIAQWALDMDHTGPLWVEGTGTFPVPMKEGHPTVTNRFNTATHFDVTAQFPGGVTMKILSHSSNDRGILFTGTKGRILVNRNRLVGKPVEQLKDNPLPQDALRQIHGGRPLKGHMQNFMDCVATREQPVSNVHSHHRTLTTCHLANIAIRLGRRIHWDAEKQEIVGDEQANSWQTREQRKGYEIDV